MTVSLSRKAPISFFSPLKLIPVFPPTAASTIESSVVGMLMKEMPRLKVAAAKPPRSVTMPPPRQIIREWRVAPPSPSALHTADRVSSVLLASEAPMVMSRAPSKAAHPFSRGRQRRYVCSSVRMKRRSQSLPATVVARSRHGSSEKMISCMVGRCVVVYVRGRGGSSSNSSIAWR